MWFLVRRCIIILVDSREQNARYAAKQFAKSGIDSEIICFPTETGTDYLISNTHGSVAIQRKVLVSELTSELDVTMYETMPALINFCDGKINPVLLIEENSAISLDGYLINRNDNRPTEMLATSYYGYLETIRKMGVEVITTRDLSQSIWYMVATHGYLEKNHYPVHKKYFSVQEQAIGMLSTVHGIGEARAMKALSKASIRGMCGCTVIEGLTEKQGENLQKVLRWRV